MSHHAQDERQALAEDLLRLGAEAPTLCEGWAAADLAAHLVIRDRRPDATLGMFIPRLAGRTERIQTAERDGHDWDELVARVRTGPPYPARLPPVDEAMNTLEYFVHHEDLLRAQPMAKPRALDPALASALWSRLKLMGRLLTRGAPVGVAVDAPGFGTATLHRSEPVVTVTGSPGELVLWVFGRRSAAQVALAGDEISVERLKQAHLGL